QRLALLRRRARARAGGATAGARSRSQLAGRSARARPARGARAAGAAPVRECIARAAARREKWQLQEPASIASGYRGLIGSTIAGRAPAVHETVRVFSATGTGPGDESRQ